MDQHTIFGALNTLPRRVLSVFRPNMAGQAGANFLPDTIEALAALMSCHYHARGGKLLTDTASVMMTWPELSVNPETVARHPYTTTWCASCIPNTALYPPGR